MPARSNIVTLKVKLNMSIKDRCIIGLLFIIVGSFCSVQGQAVNKRKTILIISSYNPASSQTAGTISDFMDEYARLGGRSVIELENMNCKSFSEAPSWKATMKNILVKYQGEKAPHLIILLGQEAWASYLSQEDSTLCTTPVMCSLASRNLVILPTEKDTLETWMPESVDYLSGEVGHHEVKSGFVNEYDIPANIRMIKHFYPQTRHIAFLSDNTYGGVSIQALVRKAMRSFPELELIQLDGRSNTIYTIVDKFRLLPKHTIVLVGTWRVDKNEGYFMRNTTYAMMEANPTLPVFSATSVSMGYWAVGGVMPAYRNLGKEMGREAIKIEAHPNDSTHRIEVIKSQVELDYKKAKELNLDLSALPFPAKIVNRPPTFYEQYTYQLWAICGVLISLFIGLCVSLLFFYRTKLLKDRLEKSEQELREAKERAEESNHLKSAFLANMSHEIRTPLNAIVGFSNVLSEGGNSPEDQRNFFEIIQANSDLLLRLINDILDLSRLESDRVKLSAEECDVISLCRQILASVSFSKAERDNTFVFSCAYDEYLLMVDTQRMQQVLINLLTNANKFTESGIITLKFEVDEQQNSAFFSVSDTGCGIPKEKESQVFERFEKLNEYAQGTGLGLSICKLTVEKWGGEIWVDPEYTDGARFVFSYPLN